MTKSSIERKYPSSFGFHPINEAMINWDFSPLTGEGFYYKTNSEKYGHIGLRISSAETTRNILMEWKDEVSIPIKFRSSVIKVLSFFVSYLEGLKGQKVSILFEVFEGSSHHLHSDETSFELATHFALHDCFGKPIQEITESNRKLIANLKESGNF